MVEIDMPKVTVPEGLSPAELHEIMRTAVRAPGKSPIGTFLSKEGHRIIGQASRKYGVDKTKALEIILRQWRENDRE